MLDLLFSRNLWLLVFLPGILVALFAHWRFGRAFRRFSQVPMLGKVTGARAARVLLDRNGMANIELYETDHVLSDHYDPRRRCVFLSNAVAMGRTVAAVAVAAHVVAHATQYKLERRFFRLRMLVVGSARWITILVLLLIGFGYFSEDQMSPMLGLSGVAIYLGFVLLQLVTMVVEFDANRMASRELLRTGVIQAEETRSIRRMLNATAWLDLTSMMTAFFGLGRMFIPGRRGDEE